VNSSACSILALELSVEHYTFQGNTGGPLGPR